jgi:hypothetical protein
MTAEDDIDIFVTTVTYLKVLLAIARRYFIVIMIERLEKMCGIPMHSKCISTALGLLHADNDGQS